MTLEERFAVRYPNMKSWEVEKRIAGYDMWKRELAFRAYNMTPKLRHSPKFLDVTRLAPVLCKHTYGTICEYAWAFSDYDGFETVVSVAEEYGLKANRVRPDDADDYILPTIFIGYIWDALSSAGIKRYSELACKTVQMTRSSHQLSVSQRDALKARGIHAKSGRFRIQFDVVGVDYCEQYALNGYIRIPNYVKSTAEAIEEQVKSRYPGAHLQFDRDLGVVIR